MSENFIEFSNDELSLPFTVDELFTDEDYDLVYGKNIRPNLFILKILYGVET